MGQQFRRVYQQMVLGRISKCLINYNSFTLQLDKNYVKQMNGNRTTRTAGSKPVNINISFTINPKNILNQQNFDIENQLKNKKISGALQVQGFDKQTNSIKSKTPDLVNTERVDFNRDLYIKQEEKKEKKSRKRNSVDESYLNQYNKRYDGQKSINLNKQSQSLHIRKSSTKSKKQNETSVKRKHNKTVSKVSALESYGIKPSLSVNGALVQQRQKNLKSIINRLMTNQLSKKSLPLELPTQQYKTARKKKVNRKKQLKQGRSQNLIRRNQGQMDIDAINRKMIIEKLTSLRSMNNSIFKSEEDQELRPRERRTIVINTDHSIDCIDEIHEMEKQAKKSKNNKGKQVNEQKDKANQTRSLIDQYLAILNENIQYEGQIVRDQQNDDIPIQEQFNIYRQQFNPPNQYLQIHKYQESKEKKRQEKSINSASISMSPQKSQLHSKIQQNDKNIIRPFCSSQMTKQQKMISQIQRVKLNQLKKHEVQKWGQLLTFIKKSMNEGKSNHDEILLNIYQFLQQTKSDLQKQISKDNQKSRSKEKDALEQFTNKFSSNQYPKQVEQQQVFRPAHQNENENQKSFNEISSMSYKDQDYEEQNQQLKLMNLQMIQNALKSRHQSLLQKKDRQISLLEEQKNTGKLTQNQFIAEKQKLQKWTKKQTTEIMQARKNIWKGYNEAKGIIQKSLKSKHFQQQSAKKRSMMKCLSQDYLLKNYNYKKLLQRQQDSEGQQSESLESSKKQIENQNSQIKSVSKKSEHSKSHIEDLQSPQKKQNQKQEQKQKVSDQFKHLSQEEDIQKIKQRLLDIKQKHLIQDRPDSPQQKSNDQISYEEVDNQLQDSISENEMKLISQELNREGKLPQPDRQKLKHVLPQDKQDIFQFIFLDLSIQLYQQPCHDNRIMESINKYVSYMKRQANKKRGVKTNLNIVKQYLKRFLGFILRAHKNVLQTLDQPVGPTAVEMLKYMHENDDDPAQCQQPPSPLVIPTSVFDAFQKLHLPGIEFEAYYENDQQKQAKRIQFLKNILHIHNKALFDAMNEYLDLLRPFGIWGKPFPWKNSSSFFHLTSQQQKQDKLKKASEKVVQYCSYVCGLLVDKQQSLVGNARLSQDYIEQIKQDRLSRMLATQLMQNQQRWLFYDDEETEVLVEISNAVYLIMLREATHEVMEVIKKRNSIVS